jgi:hypothetical protein
VELERLHPLSFAWALHCCRQRHEEAQDVLQDVSDGGQDCTPPGKEAIGDADPGWSGDGQTIYSSRGLALVPAGLPATSLVTERKLYAFSSDPWVAGKPETDLSPSSEPACVEGVPNGSPDGQQIALFRMCYDDGPSSAPGIYITVTTGSYRKFVVSVGVADQANRPASSKLRRGLRGKIDSGLPCPRLQMKLD